MEEFKGTPIEADFELKTLTLKMDGDFKVSHEPYLVIPEKDYKVPEMLKMLKSCLGFVDQMKGIQIDWSKGDKLRNLIKELES